MPSENDILSADADLIHAIKTEAVEAFELALKRRASVEAHDHYGNTALIIASDLQRLPMMKRLLGLGANVNALSVNFPKSALHVAAETESLETTELLLQHGADINLAGWRDRTPLQAACRAGKLSQVQLLLDRGAKTGIIREVTSDSALMACFATGQKEVATYLLARFPELFTECDHLGMNALSRFAHWKAVEWVAWLLEQPMPDWLKSHKAYFRNAAAEAVCELEDYEQSDGYEQARAATMKLFRARGYL